MISSSLLDKSAFLDEGLRQLDKSYAHRLRFFVAATQPTAVWPFGQRVAQFSPELKEAFAWYHLQ